jgi:peptidyl-prolyl cis-trans isomerase SurA
MKKLLCIWMMLPILLAAQSQNDIVLTIDGEKVSREEFENIYKKNNRDSAVTAKALDDYMELFINFKLKVHAAKELGLDTVKKFVNELAGYRTQLARPYLTDTDKLNDLMKEAYQFMGEEVRASHILVKCDINAGPQDTLKAYNKIMELRKRIQSGEDFMAVAKSNGGSEDPSVANNGGDLGYFTAFQMVYPFEKAAFAAKVGELSMPFRTRYGYHILKLTDRRPARGEIQVAHIVIRPKTETKGDEGAKMKLEEIRQKVVNGEESFEDLAKKYSDDPSSSKKGGELPWFGTGKMVPEFEDASFGLKKDGDVSMPFKTEYGWHIVKRLKVRTIPTYAEAEKDLKNKVSKDGRSEQTRKSFVEKLKKDFSYSYNQEVFKKILAAADSNALTGKLYVKEKDMKTVLFSYAGKSYSVGEFVEYFRTKGMGKAGINPGDHVNTVFAKLVEDKLIAEEDSKLEQKHTAFRLLMKEYREGILLFELTDQKVWSKAVKDSAGLAQYYDLHKEQFMWPERADVVIFTCANSKIAADARKMLLEGKDRSTVAGELNQASQLNLQIEQGLFSREDKPFLKDIEWKKGYSKEISSDGQIVFTEIKEILAPRPKKLEEAKGLITSEYQNFLEKLWIEELRSKYKFEINKDVLHSIH